MTVIDKILLLAKEHLTAMTHCANILQKKNRL